MKGRRERLEEPKRSPDVSDSQTSRSQYLASIRPPDISISQDCPATIPYAKLYWNRGCGHSTRMQPGAGPPAPTMDISPESLRVLVVESNASARESIVQLLKECSYQVTHAAGCVVCWQGFSSSWRRTVGADLLKALCTGHGREGHRGGSAASERAAGSGWSPWCGPDSEGA